ncbi:MAG: hypothetical protein K9M75_06325 [Phycisphaerae bacterium]|nr:hypothetical protein [Phycisphaerae bacterium]
MKTNHTTILLPLLLLSATVLAGNSENPDPDPAGKTLNVLFIGNSYIYVNNLDIVLKNLALSANPQIKLNTKRIVKGGSTLQRHYNDPNTLTQIRKGKWDYIILQEQSLRPATDPEKFYTYAEKLHSEIQKTSAKTVFFMTWARQKKPDMILPLSTAYTKIAKQVKAQTAPAGLAWELSLKRKPKLILHSKDGSHPNKYGTYLAACVFYATLTGQSPVGLSNAKIKEINPETSVFLQTVAWDAVKAYKKICNTLAK